MAPSQQTPSSTWEAKIDDLLRRNLASQLYETRKPLMDEIQRIISDKLPQIPLVVEYIAAAADKRVANFEPYALDGGLTGTRPTIFAHQEMTQSSSSSRSSSSSSLSSSSSATTSTSSGSSSSSNSLTSAKSESTSSSSSPLMASFK